MAENFAITPGTGITVSAEDIAGVHVERIKLLESTAAKTAGLSKQRDVVAGATDDGLLLVGIRNEGGSDWGTAEGRYTPIAVDRKGRIRIDTTVPLPVDISATSIQADQGTASGAAGGWPVKVTDGTDTVGISTVAAAKALKVDVIQTVGAGGTQFAEDTAHMSGDVGTLSLVVRKDAAGTLVTLDGDYSPLQVDASGNLRVTGGGGGAEFAEDTAHTTGALGNMPLAVRNDAGTSLVDTSGDYAPLQVDSSGALRVAGGGGGIQYTEADTDASITGTAILWEDAADTLRAVSAAKPLPVNLVLPATVPVSAASLPLPTGAATEATLAAASGKLPAALVGGRLDVTIGASPATIPVSAASLPLPTGAATEATLSAASGKLPATLGQKAMTASMAVVLASDQSAITVASHAVTNAGTFAVQADTELPAAAALTDNFANPTAPGVGAFGMVWDGAAWDRAAGTSADGALVNLGTNNDVTVTSGTVTVGAALPAGDNNIGNVDVVTLPALVAGNANIGDVDIASAPTGASAIQNQGAAAHDAAVAGNPLAIGFRANTNEPVVVSADGDAVWGWADPFGRQVVIPGHPNPEAPVAVNLTADGTVIAAPGASLSLYICKGSVHNRDAANNTVALEDGSGGTERWKAELAAEGGGSLFDFGERGWKLTANTGLFADLGGAGDVDINITSYYVAA